ncbi:hypothetical protein AB0L41_47750 [Amycolatopsis mediterranei]|uniref:hypothetical protein n=1 Tax=Amycolatopsis mediterranei TaxID=33910 RepID=UPI00342384D8
MSLLEELPRFAVALNAEDVLICKLRPGKPDIAAAAPATDLNSELEGRAAYFGIRPTIPPSFSTAAATRPLQ